MMISVAHAPEKATAFLQPAFMRTLIGLYWLVGAGCTYHFTNEHVVRPEGIRTVAVEAVYDTSREVLPHELLWESLQAAFAADGHLRLAPQSSADALVRAHVRQGSVTATGSELINGPRTDPRVFDQEDPDKPTEFKALTQAGRYRDRGQVTTVVEVEVWSLRTRTLLMTHTYPMSETFQAVHQTFTTKANDHLRYQEAADAKFKLLSQGIARAVVRDLFVR